MGPRDEVITVKEPRCSSFPSSEVLELARVKGSGPPHDGLALPHRSAGGLQGLEGLLVVAHFLHALSLQVALAHLLQEADVGTSDPPEERQCLPPVQEHCGRRGRGQRPEGAQPSWPSWQPEAGLACLAAFRKGMPDSSPLASLLSLVAPRPLPILQERSTHCSALSTRLLP